MTKVNSPVGKQVETFLSPGSFIRAASAAHPAFRYAIAVAGILAIVVAFSRFGVGYEALAFGAVAVIALMALFLIFAQAARLSGTNFDLPAKVLIWFVLLIAMLVVSLLVGSVFFDRPLPLRSVIMKSANPAPPALPKTNANELSPAQRSLLEADIVNAYKAVGYQMGYFNSWARPPTLQTMRVTQKEISATAPDGRVVSMSIDPKQLPAPQFYNSNTIASAAMSPSITDFFSAYQQYRDALAHLASLTGNYNGAIIGTMSEGRKVLDRGRAALCGLGSKPPLLFPDGRAPEPGPTGC